MKRYAAVLLVVPVAVLMFLVATPEARGDDGDRYFKYQDKYHKHQAKAYDELAEGDLDEYYEEMDKAGEYEHKARQARREYLRDLDRRHHRDHWGDVDIDLGLRFHHGGFFFRMGSDSHRPHYRPYIVHRRHIYYRHW